MHYKQKITEKDKIINKVNVLQGKYILGKYNEIGTIKTLLGSCVSLVGYNSEHKLGFMTHLQYIGTAEALTRHLKYSIDTILNSGNIDTFNNFKLYISGGNNIIGTDIGNILLQEQIHTLTQKYNINISNIIQIHTKQKQANRISLDLYTGKFTNKIG